jgi:hypothetical protein
MYWGSENALAVERGARCLENAVKPGRSDLEWDVLGVVALDSKSIRSVKSDVKGAGRAPEDWDGRGIPKSMGLVLAL